MKASIVEAFWGPRADSPAACAAGLLPVVAVLRTVHPAFEALYQARMRGRDPLVPMPSDVVTLTAAIEREVIRNDTDRAVMEGAGYSASWNDNTRRFEQAAVYLVCGSLNQGNALQVTLPPEAGDGSVAIAALEALLAAMVDGFAPDWAGVHAADAKPRYRGVEQLPTVGPLLYLRGPVAPVRTTKARVERWATGTLFIATPSANFESDVLSAAADSLRLEHELTLAGVLA